MIEIQGIVPWCGAERSSREELDAREIHVAASRLSRAVRFYSRVFGMLAVRAMAGGDVVVMRVTPNTDLVIHDAGSAVRQRVRYVRRWGFTVTNLDRVREQVWDLGVVVARDSGAPDQIYRWTNGRSLYVRAPDGIELELVETWDVHACAGSPRVCAAI